MKTLARASEGGGTGFTTDKANVLSSLLRVAASLVLVLAIVGVYLLLHVVLRVV